MRLHAGAHAHRRRGGPRPTRTEAWVRPPSCRATSAGPSGPATWGAREGARPPALQPRVRELTPWVTLPAGHSHRRRCAHILAEGCLHPHLPPHLPPPPCRGLGPASQGGRRTRGCDRSPGSVSKPHVTRKRLLERSRRGDASGPHLGTHVWGFEPASPEPGLGAETGAQGAHGRTWRGRMARGRCRLWAEPANVHTPLTGAWGLRLSVLPGRLGRERSSLRGVRLPGRAGGGPKPAPPALVSRSFLPRPHPQREAAATSSPGFEAPACTLTRLFCPGSQVLHGRASPQEEGSRWKHASHLRHLRAPLRPPGPGPDLGSHLGHSRWGQGEGGGEPFDPPLRAVPCLLLSTGRRPPAFWGNAETPKCRAHVQQGPPSAPC